MKTSAGLSSRALRTRRDMFGLGGGSAPPAGSQVQGTTSPKASENPQIKVLRRISYGPTEADVKLMYMMGSAGYLEQQLTPDKIDDSACDARIGALSNLGLTPFQLAPLSSTTVTREVQDAAVLRAVYSRRQLLERTVEFWSDHFTSNINTVGIHKVAEVRDVYRLHAMGNFCDMLLASGQGAAMLAYLNGQQNSRTAPNQNYAREIMELHTLGVNGGYTQTDIVNVAKCFTGWRYNSSSTSATYGAFAYSASQHDNSAKLVLGNTIAANGGLNDGLTVMKILTDHPSTHAFLARKLLRWFIRYDPSDALVADVAELFRQTKGDITQVLRRVLSYENLQNETQPLLKRPYHFIVSALRATRATITAMDSLRGTYLSSVGQLPYTWGPPNGFPHDADYWGELQLPRWNFAFSLSNSSISGAAVDITALQGGLTDPLALADRIDMLCCQNEMPVFHKKALVGYLSPSPVTTSRARDAFGLVLSSPAFQWH